MNAKIYMLKIFPLALSFIIPFVILYFLYPKSFEATWEGRTYYIFFLWLFFLETWMAWEELPNNFNTKSLRTVAFIIALPLPTLYVIAANYYGVNTAIQELATNIYIHPNMIGLIPLSTEYLVLTILFTLIISLGFGVSHLWNFSISVLFLGAIGSIYMINNLYPYGTFIPFQFIVPTTATLAMNVLNLMGYHTVWLGYNQNMPTIIVQDSQGNRSLPFTIAWPCAGVESLIIYTLTIWLFLKKSGISWIAKVIYFIIGAVITYFINVLRIVTIYIISIEKGDWRLFHDYYGQLYSIIWITSYPLIIIGSQLLWSKIKSLDVEKIFKSNF
jgi:thaumarchaeosortase